MASAKSVFLDALRNICFLATFAHDWHLKDELIPMAGSHQSGALVMTTSACSGRSRARGPPGSVSRRTGGAAKGCIDNAAADDRNNTRDLAVYLPLLAAGDYNEACRIPYQEPQKDRENPWTLAGCHVATPFARPDQSFQF